MPRFCFPALLLEPSFDGATSSAGSILVVKRLWQTSTFDFATLASRHSLHLPYQLMDVFLAHCNLEFQLPDSASVEEACETMLAFRLQLYAQGLSPFLLPVVASHSINEYSGINSRDSESLRAKLPDGLREGITSDTAKVEAWPFELSLNIHLIKDRLSLGQAALDGAAKRWDEWQPMASVQPALKVFENGVNSAPTILSLDQAILHLWSSLESLFPTVTSELSFKVALYLAQIQNDRESRRFIFDQARRSYKVRCGIAHGSQRGASAEQWESAWDLAMATTRALLARGRLPDEEELLDQLLPS